MKEWQFALATAAPAQQTQHDCARFRRGRLTARTEFITADREGRHQVTRVEFAIASCIQRAPE